MAKKPKMLFVVSTCCGDEQTWAVSDRQAISNVQHRLRMRGVSEYSLGTGYWEVRRVGMKENCRV